MARWFVGRRCFVGALCCLGALSACADWTSPAPVARIAAAPSFSTEAIEDYRQARLIGLIIDNVHVRLTRAAGEVVRDVSSPIAPNQDSIVIDIVVPLSAPRETVRLLVELRQGSLVLFAGSAEFVVEAGPISQVPLVPLIYVGPPIVPRTPLPEPDPDDPLEPPISLPLPSLPILPAPLTILRFLLD